MNKKFQIQPAFTKDEPYELWRDLALKNGLFFEVFDNQSTAEVLLRRKDELRKNNLVNSVHASFIDVNPVSNNPQILKVSRDQLLRSCNLAQELGAENIVIHGSCFPFLRDQYFEDWVQKSADYYDTLSKETGLKVFIENSQDLDPTPLESLMKSRQSNNVNVCLDIGHANISRENLQTWFNSLSSWIKYIHLSDNSGFFDRHLILGNGTVDWFLVNNSVTKLQRDLIYTLEVGGPASIEKSLKFIKDHGFFGSGSLTPAEYAGPKPVALDPRISSIGSGIIRDMSEGVIAIGFDGIIWYVNDSACSLLEIKKSNIEKRTFSSCFLEYSENDKFNQLILDAMYDREKTHNDIVDYFTGSVTKKFHIHTSFSKENGKKLGIVVVFSDVSEVVELRDSVKMMDQIKDLNDQLNIRNKLLGQTFGRYLSDEIVKKILDSPEGLKMGGEKKNLTILMSDLRGFTFLSEKLQANDLMAMLNHYLGEMTRLISSFHGTIIEFIGDAILAIFGAPKESDYHPSDAIAAAIAMQSKMDEINLWNKNNGFPNLQMGIGICTGDVIVGNIGSERHAKYGVVGSNVNLCGRIESFCTGGQIYISQETFKACTSELSVEEKVQIQAKGISEPVSIYRVNGIGEPYNQSYQQKEETPRKLEQPLPITLRVLDGKFAPPTLHTGKLTALSHRNAIIQASLKLERFDNLQLFMPDEAFAKVSQVIDNSTYFVTFTI